MKITESTPASKRVSNIRSERIKVELTADDNHFQIEEMPPFADFPNSKKYSYKFLGYTKNKKGETIQTFSVRKRRKQKDKHLTLKWNATIKVNDITDIKDNDNYKLVSVRLGLPKAAIRNLKNEFNNFLNPIIPTSVNHKSDTNKTLKIMETKKYAFGIIRMLLEKDEIFTEEVMERFNITKPSALKYLIELKQHKIIESDSTRHNKKVYMLKLDRNELKEMIKEYFNV